MESVPTDESLAGIAAVPQREGGGNSAPVLIGVGRNTLYRFEDPLGTGTPFWRSLSSIERIGTAPGLIFVWVSTPAPLAHGPVVLDAQTGAFVTTWTNPVTSIAFLDARRGAAVFVGSGLSVTSDGGATWRLVAPLDIVRRVHEVTPMGGALWGEYGYKSIDVDTATITLENYDPRGPALQREQWITEMDRTMNDPLWALRDGIDLGNDAALMPIDGGLARVDLTTGLGTLLPDGHHPELDSGCPATQAGRSAWFACAKKRRNDSTWHILQARLDAPHIVTEALSFSSRDTVELFATTAGGLEVSPCGDSSRRPGSCVLEPDGTFAFVDARSTAGATRDGALYRVRPIHVGAPRAQLTALYPSGTERVIDEFPLPEPMTRLESLDEDNDGTIHIVLGGATLSYVRIKSGAKPQVTNLDGVTSAQYRAGHGYGRGPNVTMESRGGLAWEKAAGPPEFLLRLGGEPGRILVNRLGAEDSDLYRVHWGPDANREAPAPNVLPPFSDPPWPDFSTIHCKRRGVLPSLGGAPASTEFEPSAPPAGFAGNAPLTVQDSSFFSRSTGRRAITRPS